MRKRENLTAYETMPEDLAIYLSHYGPHFNKACFDFAVSQMYDKNDNKIKAYSKEDIENLMNSYGIKVRYAQLYDCAYVATMCKADYLGNSITDEHHLCLYVKDSLDDPDGADGLMFNRWIADMKWLGIAIPWDEFI